jgi:hypothetical protein
MGRNRRGEFRAGNEGQLSIRPEIASRLRDGTNVFFDLDMLRAVLASRKLVRHRMMTTMKAETGRILQ